MINLSMKVKMEIGFSTKVTNRIEYSSELQEEYSISVTSCLQSDKHKVKKKTKEG